MEQQQPTTAAEQVANLSKNLLQAFVEREEAQAKLDAANVTIKAIRNALAGVPIGQKLEGEVIQERAQAAAAEAAKHVASKASAEDLGNVKDIKTVLHR